MEDSWPINRARFVWFAMKLPVVPTGGKLPFYYIVHFLVIRKCALQFDSVLNLGVRQPTSHLQPFLSGSGLPINKSYGDDNDT